MRLRLALNNVGPASATAEELPLHTYLGRKLYPEDETSITKHVA